ncbi:MAG: integrase core domain-containing protein [Granulosicoccus sp.]
MYRDECLNRWLFDTAQKVRNVSDLWLNEYNHFRPHSSLGLLTPIKFMELCETRMKMVA